MVKHSAGGNQKNKKRITEKNNAAQKFMKMIFSCGGVV
jgi:hypothetical protein